MFDPLDRPIFSFDDEDQEVDQTTKRDDLLKLIEQMPSMKGSDLSVPVSNQLQQKLDNMFEDMQKKCNRIVRDYVDRAVIERESMVDEINEDK